MKKDMLTTIVELQDCLNDKVGLSQKKALQLPFEERMSWIRRYLEALVTEAGEALVEAGMKWWKKHYDEEALKEELIDCLHFLLSAMLLAGMNAEDIYKAYLKKNEKNFVRKDWDVNRER